MGKWKTNKYREGGRGCYLLIRRGKAEVVSLSTGLHFRILRDSSILRELKLLLEPGIEKFSGDKSEGH